MGILSAFLGGLIRPVITSSGANLPPPNAARTAVDLVDVLFTSDEERLDKQAVLARISLKADQVQAQINQAEARHPSRFVAGWRPFIGWVCGVALAWHFLLQPITLHAMAMARLEMPPLPVFDLTQLNTILFGMLGLGTLRTAEKAAGKTR
ncbi:MAG: hypothetical protein J4F41_05685 [Alphaproteobacteria bacterium]|nr:hypothetical protein [Alphaproteobacteria bacterium]